MGAAGPSQYCRPSPRLLDSATAKDTSQMNDRRTVVAIVSTLAISALVWGTVVLLNVR
jgi:hypothetical protein